VTEFLHRLVCIVGVTAFSLTFFHPVFWAPVGLALGAALLLLTPRVVGGRLAEPPAHFVALIWIVATALLALANGMSEEFFNARQIVLVAAGLVFGYFLSLERVPPWLAWSPFALFAMYFAASMLAGRDPNTVFTRNSQNYISVILLAMYASAVIMSRPPRVRPAHVAAAGLVVILAVWAAGRGGILASLLLTIGLISSLVLRGRGGLARWLVLAVTAASILVVAFLAIGFLESGGYLYKFEGRGLRDPSRLTLLVAYFQNMNLTEFLLGRNYYDNSVIGQWSFNLHNSYLDAWAHLGIAYFLFVLAVILTALRRAREQPVIAIATLAFAARAATDSQLFSGQYDFVAFSVLFLLLRRPASRRPPEPAIPFTLEARATQ
jgi:O-antigen ligase